MHKMVNKPTMAPALHESTQSLNRASQKKGRPCNVKYTGSHEVVCKEKSNTPKVRQLIHGDCTKFHVVVWASMS